MNENEIKIIKECAALVAKAYDFYEPWICPNVILKKFGISQWELCDGYWYDNETGTSYYFL